MVPRLRQFLVVLIAFAIVGGATSPVARSAEYAAPMMMAGMPCDMMMSQAGADHGKPMVPCKGMTPDCIKQMGCVTDIALPARTMAIEVTSHSSDVDYWSIWYKLTDFTREPEPLPPRTT